MSVIGDFLKQILTAYYGKDVRQSIHDAIKQCYDDATGNPESVAAVVEQNDKMKELLENTPYTTVESEGEFELPVHTINDSKISDDSTWSSKKIIDAIYPIGSIYMSVNNVNPSELLGGTWVAWGAGRVPVGVGTGTDSNGAEKVFSSAEDTDGEYSHTLIIDEMPSHNHVIEGPWIEGFSGWTNQTIGKYYTHKNTNLGNGDLSNSYTAKAVRHNFNMIIGDKGGGQAHNNIQPYITCYMWKRTA